MSTYKYSSKAVEDGETSSVSLMYHTSKDTENNDHTILDDNCEPEVNDIGKPLTSYDGHLPLSTGESEMFDELSEAIQNRNLERLQNSMNRLYKSDKVKMLLHSPSLYSFIGSSCGCLIIQAMFFDLDCFKYLLELYEKLKPTLETLPFAKFGRKQDGFVTLFPFRTCNFTGENLLYCLHGENALIVMEYLSKCSVLDQLINQKHERNVTPLFMAIICDEIPLALKIVELGGYVDRVNDKGGSPIYEAVIYGHMSLVKTMLQFGKTESQDDICTNDKLYYGRSIFYPAILSGNREVIEYLQNYVQNSTNLLSKEMKNDNRGALEESIVRNNMTDLLNSLLKDTSSENQFPEFVIAGICMRAVELNNQEMVSMILESQYGREALKFTDTSGRTVLHHGSKYPKLLKYLLDTAEQIFDKTNDMGDIINKADKDKCTALHYAAVAGDGESLQALAEWSVRFNNQTKDLECDYILSCVTCEKCAEMISLEAIKYAIKSTRSDENSSVQLTKDILFNTVASKGRTDLLQYLFEIQVPGSKKRDQNGWTALHAAVFSGSLPTVKLLVKHLPSLLNVKNREGDTPAFSAAKQQQHSVLKYLFEVGVKPVDESHGLNLLDIDFLDNDTYIIVADEILKLSGREGLTKAIQVNNSDWMFHSKTAVHILNAYVTRVDSFVYIDDFSVLKGSDGGYTDVIRWFADLGFDECLSHPLVRLFLKKKLYSSTARKWYFLNAFLYFVFLILLTVYVGLYSQGSSSVTSPTMISLTVLILFLCSINMVKELLQIRYSLYQYLYEDFLNNLLEWILYICTFVFLLPVNDTKSKSQIEAGAIAIFIAWINFIWFLKRLPLFGIYVILTKKVFFSLLKILPVVALFVIAFAMTFLLLRSNDYAFSTIPWSALTTFIMMGGEIDYRDVFLDNKSSVYMIQCVFLVLFFLVMSIVVMNVFVGLAVGDTGEMMNRSKAEKHRGKALLYLELEKSLSKLPRYFRPKEISSDTIFEPVKDKTDKEKDSQIETKIEDIKSELQNIKNDMNLLKDIKSELQNIKNDMNLLKLRSSRNGFEEKRAEHESD